MGRYSRELAPRLIESARVEPGMAVVDIGCGPGALTERWSSAWARGAWQRRIRRSRS